MLGAPAQRRLARRGPRCDDARVPAPIPWPEALRTFAAIGAQSFGGPAGQIAVMHRVLVEEKKWISEARFLHALNYCTLLPGPEAMQLVTYVGWLAHRTLGGIVAGSLFVLPGFLSILLLSFLYVRFRDVGWVAGLFFGIKAAVLAVVVEAVLRIGKRALKNGAMVSIAVLAFVAIFFFEVPFPLIVVAAGLVGLAGGKLAPGRFLVVKGRTAAEDPEEEARLDAAWKRGELGHTRPSTAGALRTLALWLALWLGPVALLARFLGPDHVFTREAVFFSQAAVVTFGGAYSVLAYIAQQAVEVYGWLRPGEMLDGLGMAETTPGPLIQVVQFVGFLGATRDPGSLSPLAAGFWASVIVTWVTYVPCFLWIFVGAPYLEALRSVKSLTSALSAITAAVVGVVLNLGVWFALRTFFGTVDELRLAWGLRLEVPELATVDWTAVVLALAAGVALFRLHWGMLRTLGASALLGVLARAVLGL
jgi:chromate transporter